MRWNGERENSATTATTTTVPEQSATGSPSGDFTVGGYSRLRHPDCGGYSTVLLSVYSTVHRVVWGYALG